MNTPLTQSLPLSPESYFVEKLNSGEFVLQQCRACKQFIHFPRLMCTACGSQNLQWHPASGLGTVYSFTIVRRKPERGGDYSLALIDLDEGPRMLSRVEGIDTEAITIGLRVSAYIDSKADVSKVLFTPMVQA